MLPAKVCMNYVCFIYNNHILGKTVKCCVTCGEHLVAKDKEMVCYSDDAHFKVSINFTPDDIEREFQHMMTHCYCCGEHLTKQERKLRCVDGCGLVEVQLGTGICTCFSN